MSEEKPKSITLFTRTWKMGDELVIRVPPDKKADLEPLHGELLYVVVRRAKDLAETGGKSTNLKENRYES